MIHHADDLRGVQAEDGLVTGAVLPMAGAAGGKADAYAEIRQHADLARALEDEFQLAGHFQHEHDFQAHFLRMQREVDELLVLVAVADDVGFRIVHVGQRGDQLGLGAGFQAVVVFFPELGDFLDHLALLVHLDRIDAAVFAAVAGVLDRLAEGLVDLRDPRVQQVAETQQYRQVCAAVVQAFDHVEKRDLLAGLIVFQAHGDMALAADAEEAVAPGFHAVEFGGLFRGPGIGRLAFGGFRSGGGG